MKRIETFLLAGLLLGAGPGVWRAAASLTAVVTPGYQFPTDPTVVQSEGLLTLANLNALGQPVITITGTVGGSNTLSPGSVTMVQLSDTIVDGTTLGFGATLQVNTQGIFTNNLNTNDWVWPLSEPSLASGVVLNADPIMFGSTNPYTTNDWLGLQLNYDPQFFGTNSAAVTWTNSAGLVRTNASTGLTLNYPTNTVAVALTNGATAPVYLGPAFTVRPDTNVVNGTTNAGLTLDATEVVLNYPMAAGPEIIYTNAHGLGRAPRWFSVFAVCGTNDAASGYASNELVSAQGIWAQDTVTTNHVGTLTTLTNALCPLYSVSADATNIYFHERGVTNWAVSFAGGNGMLYSNNWAVYPRLPGAASQNAASLVALLKTNWSLVLCARP